MPEMERVHRKYQKWPSLRPLELKSKFIQQFTFSENSRDMNVHVLKMLLESKTCLTLQQLFSMIQIFLFF